MRFYFLFFLGSFCFSQNYERQDVINTSLTDIYAITVEDNFIYVGGRNAGLTQILRYDLSNPTLNPVLIFEKNAIYLFSSLMIKDNNLYFVRVEGADIYKIDLTSIPVTTEQSVYSGVIHPEGASLDDNLMYISENLNGEQISVVDLSATTITKQVIAAASNPRSITHVGNSVYFCNFFTLESIDVSSIPSSTQIFVNAVTNSTSNLVHWNGNLFYGDGGTTKYISLSNSSVIQTYSSSHTTCSDYAVFNNELYGTSCNGIIYKFVEVLSVDDINNNRLKIYPNPVQTYLNIEGFDFDNYEVYDAFGKIVLNNSTQSISENKLNLSSLNSGIYFLKINDFKPVKLIKK